MNSEEEANAGLHVRAQESLNAPANAWDAWDAWDAFSNVSALVHL